MSGEKPNKTLKLPIRGGGDFGKPGNPRGNPQDARGPLGKKNGPDENHLGGEKGGGAFISHEGPKGSPRVGGGGGEKSVETKKPRKKRAPKNGPLKKPGGPIGEKKKKNPPGGGLTYLGPPKGALFPHGKKKIPGGFLESRILWGRGAKGLFREKIFGGGKQRGGLV